MRVNRSRVIVGGIAGGVVVFIVMAIVNTVFLSGQWKSWMSLAMPMLRQPPMGASMALWFAQSLAVGFTGAAIYAGIRPRYGAGPKTALWAGFLVWVVAYLAEYFNGIAVGCLPVGVLVGETIGGFIAAMAATLTAGTLYKE